MKLTKKEIEEILEADTDQLETLAIAIVSELASRVEEAEKAEEESGKDGSEDSA